MAERLYTTRQVADLLGASAPTIDQWIDRGWLTAERVPGQSLRISEAALVRFLKDRGVDLDALMAQVVTRDAVASRAAAPPPETSNAPEPAPPEPGIHEPPVLEPAAEAAGYVPPAIDAPPAPEPATPDRVACSRGSLREHEPESAEDMPRQTPAWTCHPREDEPPAAAAPAPAADEPAAREPAPPAAYSARQVLDAVLRDAIKRNASAIHLTPEADGLALSLRIAGRVRPKSHFKSRLPRPIEPLLIAECKALAGLNLAVTTQPQCGRGAMQVNGGDVDVQVSTLPTAYGESVVVLMRSRTAPPLRLEDLGLSQHSTAALQRLLAAPAGLLVVSAAPGEDLRAALDALTAALVARQRRVIGVAAAGGIELPGMIQAAPSTAQSGGPAAALRAAMRQDADALRADDLTAPTALAAALEAAAAGCLVLGGLPSLWPATDPSALLAAGADPPALAAHLLGILTVKRAARLCPQCRKPATPAPDLLERLGLRPEGFRGPAYAAPGCGPCGGAGTVGEVRVSALMMITEDMSTLMRTGADAAAVRLAGRRHGNESLRDAAIEKMRTGTISPEEAVRVADGCI